MTQAKMRVGIIGAGWVAGARHLPSYNKLPGTDVCAIYDRDVERARALAKKSPGAIPSDNIDAFFAQDLDLVSICTPPWTHHDLAVTAMERGCHVFTEKPMAMSHAECLDMVATSERMGRQLCVSHNFLFSRSLLRARTLMQQGKLGSIQQVMGFQLSSPQRRLPTWYDELPGGLFFDEAPHLLYLIRHFLGDLKIDFTSIRRDDGKGAIASLQAALSGASANAALTMTFSAPVSEWLLVLVGSKQVLVIDIFRDILIEANSDGSHSAQEILINSLRFGAGLGAGFVTSGFLHGTNHLFYGHDVLIRQFIRSIHNGESPPVTGRDGAAIVAAMEALLAGGKRIESRVDPSHAA